MSAASQLADSVAPPAARRLSWLFLIASLMAAPALASNCMLQLVGPASTTVSLLPGGTPPVTFQIRAVSDGNGPCTLADVEIETISDSTAGTLLEPDVTEIEDGQAATFSIDLPAWPAGGGSATFEASCFGGCESATFSNPTFTVNINEVVFELTRLVGNGELGRVSPNTSVDVGVRLTVDGQPVDEDSIEYLSDPTFGTFSPSSSVVTDSSGRAEASWSASVESAYVLRAWYYGDSFGKSSSGTPPISIAFNVLVQRERTLAIDAGDNGEGMPGDTLAMVVLAQDDGAPPVPSPQPILWELVEAPAGTSLVNSSTGTMSDGRSTNSVSFGSATGAVVVRAWRENLDGTLASQVFFNLEVFDILLDTTPGVLTGAIDTPIEIQARVDRVGASTSGKPGQTVQFEIISGPSGHSAVLVPSSDTTDASGIARSNLIADVAGTYSVQAQYPAADPEQFKTFTITVQEPQYTLTPIDPATGAALREVGVAAPLVVELTDGDGAPISGATIEWNVDGGFETSTSTTDASGRASTSFGPPETGAFTVSARYNGPPVPTAAKSVSGPAPLQFDFVITGFTRELQAVDAPPAPRYTDSSLGGVRARVLRNDGGSTFGEDGTTVLFEIVQGAAEFAGGASSASVDTVSGGFATSPGIRLRRSLETVIVRASASGLTPVEFTLDVVASTYSIRRPVGAPVPVLHSADGTAVGFEAIVERTAGADTAPVGTATVSWSAPTAVSLGAASSTTDGSGVATNTASSLVAGDYSVTAGFDPGLPGHDAVTVAIPLRFDAPTATIKTLTKPATDSGDGQSAPLGTPLPLPLRALALDDGIAVAGVTINWSLSGDAVLSATQSVTDANGIAQVTVTLGGTPGAITITASRADASAATTSFVVSADAAPMVTLSIAGGNGQTGLIGQTAEPLRVRLLDSGVPVGGVSVLWQVVSGSASLASPASTTNADGLASAGLTFGQSPGPVVVRATAGSLSVEFRLNVVAAMLVVESGDRQTAAPGSRLPADFVARITLPASAEKADLRDVVVTWQVLSGGGTLDATQTLSDADGRVANRLTLGPEPGTQVVRASVAGGNAVEFTATASGPRIVSISGSGQRGSLTAPGGAPLVVAVQDADGNALPGRSVRWTVSGPVVLEAGSSITDASGRASMPFRYGDVAGTAVVRADSEGIGGEALFQLEAVPPQQVGPVLGNDQTGPPGQLLAEDFVITLAPSANKSLAGVRVSWEVTLGGGSLRDGGVTVTDDSGQVRNRLRLGPEPGSNEVIATLPGGQRIVFRAEAVAIAGQLAIVAGNRQVLATNTASEPLVVEVRDATGAPLPDVRVRWTAVGIEGVRDGVPNATVDQEFTTTDAQGRARNVARVLQPGRARVRAQATAVTAPAVNFELAAGVSTLPALTDEQRQTGRAVDNACAALAALATRTPAQEDLFQRCQELIDNAGDNPGEVVNALNQLPTRLVNSMADAGFETITTQLDNHSTRLEALRAGMGGGSQFNVGLSTATGTLPLSFLPSALLGAAATDEAGAEFSRWGFFATGTIGRGRSRADGQHTGFSFDTSGLTAGVDYRFSDRLFAGLSAGYARHDSELRGDRGSVDTRGWTVSSYATWFNERNWYVDGVVSYGRNDYRLERAIAYSITARDGSRTHIDQRARADTDGTLLGGSLSVGRDFQKGAWSLGTWLRGNFARVELDAYDERLLTDRPGAGLALQFDSRTLNSLSSTLGGKATYVMSRDWGVLMPYLQAEWQHEFRDDPARLVARFVHDPTGTPMEQFGSDVDTDYFNVGVGVSALLPGGRSFFLFYERLMGASRLSQGTLHLGGRIEF